MTNILQLMSEYGPAAAALTGFVALIVVLIVNSKVKKTLNRILRLKDDTKVDKSKILVEALNTINKLEQSTLEDFENLADELDHVYNKMYSVIVDAKLIQAYDRVVKTFISGTKASLVEFETLARKELGLGAVNNKTKQNYLSVVKDQKQYEINKQKQLQQQKIEHQEQEKQKQIEKENKELEKQQRQQEKKQIKQQKQLEKQRKKQQQQIEKQKIKQEKQLEKNNEKEDETKNVNTKKSPKKENSKGNVNSKSKTSKEQLKDTTNKEKLKNDIKNEEQKTPLIKKRSKKKLL